MAGGHRDSPIQLRIVKWAFVSTIAESDTLHNTALVIRLTCVKNPGGEEPIASDFLTSTNADPTVVVAGFNRYPSW